MEVILVTVTHHNNQTPDASAAFPPPNESTADRPSLIVIVGPTAVGKTAAAVALAKRFDGEVINADSRYLYQGLDIGVAKPSIAERDGIPHHLIDMIPPDAEMSLATYQAAALNAIQTTLARGRLPLLVGGTPLYVNAVVEGWRIPRVPPNPTLRAHLAAEIAEIGLPAVAARLATVDPVAAARSGANPRRVIRALEVFETTGTPMSSLEGKGPPPYRALELGLTMPRDQLYRSIDARVDGQIARGLVDEVRRLLEGGLSPTASSMTSIGYRQLVPYLQGEASLDDAVQRIKLDSHRYVRHQLTWFRRNLRIVPIDVTRPDWLNGVAAMIEQFRQA